MAYEAVESLQQTLHIILLREDNLITPPVKQRIVSIHDKAVGLQLNLKHFPDKETIREVANTAEEIIQYIFSPQNPSDCGFIDPSVILSDQLGQLAEELDSTVGNVVDYIRQRSDSALESEVDDPVVTTELIAINTSGLKRLTEKLKSTGIESEDEDPSDSPPLTNKDVAASFDDDLNDYSAIVASSSRPTSTSKYTVADFAEDPSDSSSIYLLIGS
ncbi:putative disease resistance protein RXW24L [Salvia divinorum]|uniref:Disease resistance protein RXW24L n=1 Tax=Salvia divinorum TaxID=28513 RepID=A0ABD1GRP4_SALDI